jgi:alkanesulfonate monooxygenase SsuD/methylene tetrahydromethanopterin reductase-like flavin-dependent oxidoreductase (luciferase family)
MWHPLRLVEDYAMADILIGGRVIFGVGRGYHTREVETFGAPLLDQNANREMFEEGVEVEVLFKAFEGKPFSHQDKYYTIPPEGAVSRLHLEGDHLGAGAGAAAGRMLAADPERLRARLRLHGEIRRQRRDRRRLGRRRRGRLGSRYRQHAIAIIAV